MILGFVAGLAAHGLSPIINMFQNSPSQWRLLLRYAIGCLAIIGVHNRVVKQIDGEIEAGKQTGRLTAVVVSVGAGVVAGYIAEDQYKVYKNDC